MYLEYISRFRQNVPESELLRHPGKTRLSTGRMESRKEEHYLLVREIKTQFHLKIFANLLRGDGTEITLFENSVNDYRVF